MAVTSSNASHMHHNGNDRLWHDRSNHRINAKPSNTILDRSGIHNTHNPHKLRSNEHNTSIQTGVKKMKVLDVILGLAAMVMCSLIIMSLLLDMYSSKGLNVNLNDYVETQPLYKLQQQANDSMTQIDINNAYLQNKTVGQPGSEVKSGDISQGDLMVSSLLGLTRILDYVDIFINMIILTFNSMGLTVSSPVVWFLIIGVSISVVLLLLSVFFFRWL